MIIKKVSFIILAVIVLFFSLISCKDNTPGPSTLPDDATTEIFDVKIDINALAEELFTQIEYDDHLEKVEDFVLEMLYNCEEYVTASVGYCASGGTSEAIALFECETVEYASMVVESLDTYRQSMAEDYARYTAGEVEKLNSAIINQVGKYVIFSVSSNPKGAHAIINDHIEQLLKR